MFYTVRVHNDKPDELWAEVVQLPGCFAAGSTFDELQLAVQESIELYTNGSLTSFDWLKEPVEEYRIVIKSWERRKRALSHKVRESPLGSGDTRIG